MTSDQDIEECRIEDGDVALSILNYGAITRGWWVPCRGKSVPVVLGYDDPQRYPEDKCYLGAVVGRIANRTAVGRLPLGGDAFQLSQNEGLNHLHGGFSGLSNRFWVLEPDTAGRRVRLTYRSADGEEGYPGTADIEVTVSLEGAQVTYDMRATVDRPTPINLAQHNYYNLMGQGVIWQHHLQCVADRLTPVGEGGIPTGVVEPVDGTRFDYRKGSTFTQNDEVLQGTDVNLVLPDNREPAQPTALVTAPNGLQLCMWSDQPGLQLYTASALNGTGGAHDAQTIAPFHGFCLEPQGFPNAVNEPGFPSILVTPEVPYHQRLTIEITEVAP